MLHQPSHVPGRGGEGGQAENCLATHFDVAVVRCLFVSRWSEEGIFWAVTYLHRRSTITSFLIKFNFSNIFRLRGLNYNRDNNPKPRKRSNSLPIPKIEVTTYDTNANNTPEKLPHIVESKEESITNEMHPSNKPTLLQPKLGRLGSFKRLVESKIISKSDKSLSVRNQEESAKAAQVIKSKYHIQ